MITMMKIILRAVTCVSCDVLRRWVWGREEGLVVVVISLCVVQGTDLVDPMSGKVQ